MRRVPSEKPKVRHLVPRVMLMFISSVTMILGLFLACLGGYIAYVASVNSTVLALGITGGIIVLLSLLGCCGVKHELNWLLIGYFYMNVILILFMVLFSVAAIFFQESFESWVKHHWDNPTLEYLREQDCCSTYEDTVNYLESRFVLVGAIGFGAVFLLLLAMGFTLRIVTVPIIMKSMLVNVNIIFMLVSACVVSFAIHTMHHEDLEAANGWIYYAQLSVGATVFSLSLFGIIGSKSKNRTLLLMYIVGLSLCFVMLVACGSFAFIFTKSISNAYENEVGKSIGDIACDSNLHGCSNCSLAAPDICTGVEKNLDGIWVACQPNGENCELGKTVIHAPEDQGYYDNDVANCSRCPEWTRSDIEDYLETSLQVLALGSLLFSFLIMIGFVSAVLLRKSLAGYQTDSI